MPLPGVTTTFASGGTSAGPADATRVYAIIAPCSVAAVDSVTTLSNASPTQARTALGYGVGGTYAAGVLGTPRHGDLYVVSGASTAGTVSTVTAVGVTPPTVTVAGSPVDAGDFTIQVWKAGTEAAAQVIWSQDGINWSDPVGIASPVALGSTGLTATFAAGTYALTHSYTFTATAPYLTDTGVTNAMQVLLDRGIKFGHLHIVTNSQGASDAARATAFATTFAAIATKLALFEAGNRWFGCSTEAPAPFATTTSGLSTWRTALGGSTYSALQNDRIQVCAGYHRISSPILSAVVRNSIGYSYLRRISQCPISEDPGRLMSGPLQGIVSLEHDEDVTGGLDSARFVTLRTFDDGIYVTNPNMFRVPGSDYRFVQHRRVIDRAAEIARTAYARYIGEALRANPTTGRIAEAVARDIDSNVTTQLESGLAGHMSSVTARMSRTDDILRTFAFSAEVAVQPLVYPKYISQTVSGTVKQSA